MHPTNKRIVADMYVWEKGEINKGRKKKNGKKERMNTFLGLLSSLGSALSDCERCLAVFSASCSELESKLKAVGASSVNTSSSSSSRESVNIQTVNIKRVVIETTGVSDVTTLRL